MLAFQSASFRSQFEDRESGRIIDVERRPLHLRQTLVKAHPLVLRQLTAEDLAARHLADVGDETVDQLHVVHLKREERHGLAVVDGDILGNTQGKRCLTHRRSSSDDDEVRLLPSRRHLVEFGIACRDTRESSRVVGRFEKDVVRLLDDWVYLCVVLHHVALREFEESALRLLHQRIHVHRLVEGLRFHHRSETDQLACKILLLEDARVIFDMCRRGDVGAQFDDISRSAYVLQFALMAQFLRDGHDVHGLLRHVEGLYGRIDLLVARLIERIGTQYLRDDREGVFVDH